MKKTKRPTSNTIENDEFIIDNSFCYSIGEYRWIPDISMNFLSQSLLHKSVDCKNPSAIFLESIINLFQSLDCSSSKNEFYYHAYTQSLVIYFIKALARHKIINIIDLEKDVSKERLSEQYFAILGNKPKDKDITMYGIIFTKLRPLCEEDLDLIKKIMTLLHIDEDTILFTENNGLLSAKLNSQMQEEQQNTEHRHFVIHPKKTENHGMSIKVRNRTG